MIRITDTPIRVRAKQPLDGCRFDYAVAKYCEYWNGRDPGDLDTEAPTFDDDVEAMKTMFPEGVPEKTLQGDFEVEGPVFLFELTFLLAEFEFGLLQPR
jgi:hypothetical protein